MVRGMVRRIFFQVSLVWCHKVFDDSITSTIQKMEKEKFDIDVLIPSMVIKPLKSKIPRGSFTIERVYITMKKKT